MSGKLDSLFIIPDNLAAHRVWTNPCSTTPKTLLCFCVDTSFVQPLHLWPAKRAIFSRSHIILRFDELYLYLSPSFLQISTDWDRRLIYIPIKPFDGLQTYQEIGRNNTFISDFWEGFFDGVECLHVGKSASVSWDMKSRFLAAELEKRGVKLLYSNSSLKSSAAASWSLLRSVFLAES